MGCSISHVGSRIELAGPPGGLDAIDVDMSDAPDAALALAVACIFADGASRIRGLSTLRLKETDRLEALRTEIRRVGSDATIEGDDLLVFPGTVIPARVETYDDHRMAMSFALAGLVAEGIEILDPGCVSKTWPSYFDMLESIRGG
jgi:3-phosphoshikimate 1-carboxyvinyltransferase